MTDDPDICRAAKLLIDQHGADSGLRAVERAHCDVSETRYARLLSRTLALNLEAVSDLDCRQSQLSVVAGP